MPSLMRHINLISRCSTLFRSDKLRDTDLGENQSSYILCVCRFPGISQDGLSRRLCINKSNVTRNLASLEASGYVTRRQSDTDRRVTLVYPTEKAMEALPHIREVAREWNAYLTEGFTEEETEQFRAMLEKMSARAVEYANFSDEALHDLDGDVVPPAGNGGNRE